VRTVSPSALRAPPAAPLVAPNAPKSTLASDRFIALHMIWLRIMPDEPTSAPLMISPVFPITKPVMDAAMPE